MSTFTYSAPVANPEAAKPPVEVESFVDTGAMFTCLAGPQLQALGPGPQWHVPIILADGRHGEWMGTEILLTAEGRTRHTPCLFGLPEGLPLLGAVSLEQFALAVNPLARRLAPAPVPMA